MGFESDIEQGIFVIRSEIERLRDVPGVYRMIGADETVLYVGKAKSLKKRVPNYTQVGRLPVRLQRMVALTRRMEFVHTRSEAEALLLEANLIKTLDPVYNVLLKDDKSYPYVVLTRDHPYPRVVKFRGKPDKEGDYFGPFASGQAVQEVMSILQRVFQIRNCTDSYFAARTRPCLQYHIKRCTAPCVHKVSLEDYKIQICYAKDFLNGKTRDVQQDLEQKMIAASQSLQYELAASYRDKIKYLTAAQSRQRINGFALGDADVVALVTREQVAGFQVFFFRGGQSYGNRAFFPSVGDDVDLPEMMETFLAQFYQGKEAPSEIMVNIKPAEATLLEEALSTQAGRKIALRVPQRGVKEDIMAFAVQNAREALEKHLLKRQKDEDALEKVGTLFGLDGAPQRIEVYDNSHLGGTNMVGAMIVAGEEGFQKKAYRKFNIKQAGASDDYGMMREVMMRRFKNFSSDVFDSEDKTFPDLLLIDGGLGQLHAVHDVLDEMCVSDHLVVVGIAKGEDRNAGREKFFIRGREMFQLPVHDPVLHYLQRLRDEAHRFAIGSQRIRRTGDLQASRLDNVAGIGPKRKKALLHHFGSAKAVADASVQDLGKVEGISREMAQKIYAFFHGTGS